MAIHPILQHSGNLRLLILDTRSTSLVLDSTVPLDHASFLLVGGLLSCWRCQVPLSCIVKATSDI